MKGFYLDKIKILEIKVREAINLIRKLKEDNKNLKNENMKLFSELELIKDDIKTAGRIKNEYDSLAARDRKIKEKIFDLRNKIERLNI